MCALLAASRAKCPPTPPCAGVYRSWDECKQQTDGLKGAVFKGFATLSEAQAFVQGTPRGAAVPGGSSRSGAATRLRSQHDQGRRAGPGYQPRAASTAGQGAAGRSKPSQAGGTATLTKHQQKVPRPLAGPAHPLGPPLLVGSYHIQQAEKYRLVRLYQPNPPSPHQNPKLGFRSAPMAACPSLHPQHTTRLQPCPQPQPASETRTPAAQRSPARLCRSPPACTCGRLTGWLRRSRSLTAARGATRGWQARAQRCTRSAGTGWCVRGAQGCPTPAAAGCPGLHVKRAAAPRWAVTAAAWQCPPGTTPARGGAPGPERLAPPCPRLRLPCRWARCARTCPSLPPTTWPSTPASSTVCTWAAAAAAPDLPA